MGRIRPFVCPGQRVRVPRVHCRKLWYACRCLRNSEWLIGAKGSVVTTMFGRLIFREEIAVLPGSHRLLHCIGCGLRVLAAVSATLLAVRLT